MNLAIGVRLKWWCWCFHSWAYPPIYEGSTNHLTRPETAMTEKSNRGSGHGSNQCLVQDTFWACMYIPTKKCVISCGRIISHWILMMPPAAIYKNFWTCWLVHIRPCIPGFWCDIWHSSVSIKWTQNQHLVLWSVLWIITTCHGR